MSVDAKVGIIGGGFGRYLVQHCQYPCHVYDIDPRKSDMTLPEIMSWANHIIVAVPNSQHFEVASECLSGRKHVMVLKPFVLSKTEVSMLYRQARWLRLKLKVGFNQRYRDAWDGIDESTVTNVYGHWLVFDGRPLIVDGFNNVKYDLGVHLVDLAMRYLGSKFTKLTTCLRNRQDICTYCVSNSYCNLSVEVIKEHHSDAEGIGELHMQIAHETNGKRQKAVVHEEGKVSTWRDAHTFARMITDFVENTPSTDEGEYMIRLAEFMSWS